MHLVIGFEIKCSLVGDFRSEEEALNEHAVADPEAVAAEVGAIIDTWVSSSLFFFILPNNTLYTQTFK